MRKSRLGAGLFLGAWMCTCASACSSSNADNLFGPEAPDGSTAHEGGSPDHHDGAVDPGHDATVPPEDAGHDPETDSGDGRHDSGHDARDANSEAGDHDAGADTGADSGIDAGNDTGTDTGVDAGNDSGTDAGFDSGSDAGPSDSGAECGPTRTIFTSEAGPYCPFTATGAVNCNVGDHCCEYTQDAGMPSTCNGGAAACLPSPGAIDWGCDEDNDCPTSEVCCYVGQVKQDAPQCTSYHLSQVSGTVCRPGVCNVDERTACGSQADCVVGTCTGVNIRGKNIGLCL